MPNSKGQPSVYVSSTFIDLEGHRAALKTALEKARYDVECMEKYTAFDEQPLDRCLADVAATDVYVLLIAHRYGTRPAEDNPPITPGRHRGSIATPTRMIWRPSGLRWRRSTASTISPPQISWPAWCCRRCNP